MLSVDTRITMLLDVLDRELYDFRARHEFYRSIPVPQTQALFRRLFDAKEYPLGNLLGCEPLRTLKDHIRDRGFFAIGFRFDTGDWFLVPEM